MPARARPAGNRWRARPWRRRPGRPPRPPAGRSPAATRPDSPAALRRTPGPRTACRRPPARGPAASRPCPATPTACSRPLGEKVPVCRARTQLAASKLTRHQPGLGPAIRPGFPARAIHGHRIGQSRYARSILISGANRAVQKERTHTDNGGYLRDPVMWVCTRTVIGLCCARFLVGRCGHNQRRISLLMPGEAVMRLLSCGGRGVADGQPDGPVAEIGHEVQPSPPEPRRNGR